MGMLIGTRKKNSAVLQYPRQFSILRGVVTEIYVYVNKMLPLNANSILSQIWHILKSLQPGIWIV